MKTPGSFPRAPSTPVEAQAWPNGLWAGKSANLETEEETQWLTVPITFSPDVLSNSVYINGYGVSSFRGDSEIPFLIMGKLDPKTKTGCFVKIHVDKYTNFIYYDCSLEHDDADAGKPPVLKFSSTYSTGCLTWTRA